MRREQKDQLFTPEPWEDDPEGKAPWMAGLLEVAGTMRVFADNNQIEITYTDTRQNLINSIALEFGGTVRQQNNSWTWNLRGQHAIALSELVTPYTIRRREYTVAFSAWEYANRDERKDIEKDLKDYNSRSVDTEPSSYSHLLENPHFLAGVIESRGSLVPTEFLKPSTISYIWFRLYLQSMNRGLLQAIRLKYGGGFEDRTLPSEIHPIDDHHNTARRSSYRLTLGVESAALLFNEITDFMRFRDFSTFNQ